MGGGQLDIRPSQSKNWGGRVPPPIPPGLTPLLAFQYLTHRIFCIVLETY